MYASNVENVEKRFLGKVIHCISAKKKHILRYMLVGCSRYVISINSHYKTVSCTRCPVTSQEIRQPKIRRGPFKYKMDRNIVDHTENIKDFVRYKYIVTERGNPIFPKCHSLCTFSSSSSPAVRVFSLILF